MAVTANTTYVASYHSDAGHYSLDAYYFGTSGVDQPPLHALRSGVDGPNGVFAYGATSVFPNQSFQASNYWVDVVFVSLGPDTTPPTTTALVPADGSTGASINTNGAAVSVGASVAVTFSEAMNAATINSSTFVLRDPGNAVVPSSVSYDGTTNVATLTPTTALAPSTTYTATVSGGSSGVKDSSGNALASDLAWSFTTGDAPTCPCTILERLRQRRRRSPPTTRGGRARREVPRRRRTGSITGVRFYKDAANTGTHTGSLWTSTGTLLATATFNNETASGWQQVTSRTPVAVTAEHDLRRVVSHERRPLRPRQRLLRRAARRHAAAARAAERRRRSERRLSVRRGRVPDADLQAATTGSTWPSTPCRRTRRRRR